MLSRAMITSSIGIFKELLNFEEISHLCNNWTCSLLEANLHITHYPPLWPSQSSIKRHQPSLTTTIIRHSTITNHRHPQDSWPPLRLRGCLRLCRADDCLGEVSGPVGASQTETSWDWLILVVMDHDMLLAIDVSWLMMVDRRGESSTAGQQWSMLIDDCWNAVKW